ncbi:unnamed protein product, partial [Euphydryas editha]
TCFKDHDFLPAETTDVTLVEPEAQQNEYNKENFTPERQESPSLLDTVEETLVATPPIFDLQEEKTLGETPAVTPPILDPLVNTVLQEILVTSSPMLSQHTGILPSPILNPQPSTSWAITPKDKSVINTDHDDDVDDPECFYCGEVWSKSRHEDGWIRCSLCKQWAQEACSGCVDEDEVFLCEFCS